MSVLNTQSVLSQRLDEKEQKQNAMIELAPNFAPQSTPPQNSAQNARQMSEQAGEQSEQTPQRTNAPFSSDEFNAHKEFLKNSQRQITNSDDYAPEQVEFALNFSKESDELLKNGASKKKMVDFLREQDILDAQTWAILDKESGGDDELLFDFLKQNADSVRAQVEPAPQKSVLNGERDFENLKDTSEYEKELQNRGFLNQSGQKLLAAFGLNLDQSEHNKIRHNIKEKLRQGGDESDLNELEKRYLSYTNERDSANKTINALIDLSPTDFFANLKNNILSSAESRQKDELQVIKNELKDENDYKNAVSKIKNGVKVDDLSDDEKMSFVKRSEYYDLAQGGEVKKGGMIWRNALKQIKDESELVNLKSIDEATPAQIKKLANRHEFLVRNNPFNDDKDLAEEALSEIKARFNEPERAEKLRRYGALVAKYDTIDKTKQLTYAITSKLGSNEKLSKDQQDYLDFLNELADKGDFDGIGVSNATGELGVIDKEGNFYTFKDGGIQNFLEIMGASKWNLGASTAGYIYGAKKGKTPRSKVINSILYGFGFGVVGSGADYVDTALQMDTKFDGEALIHKAVTEGALQLAFDGAALGISKLAQKGNVGANLKAAATKASNVIEKLPLGDFFVGNARRILDGQNIESAELLINSNITKEQRADIEAALAEFGGKFEIGNTQHGQIIADKLAQKYGSESSIAKTAQQLVDVFNTKGYKERQAKLLQWTMSDESGKNLSYLLEVTQQSPQAQRGLENIIKYSGEQLKNAISKLGLSENQTKAIFDEFAKGTSESYGRAMNLIAEDLFDEKVYKVSIDKTPFDELLGKLKDEKLYLTEPDKAFVRDIIEPLFSGELSFKQLNHIRENLNAYLREIKNPSLKNYVKGQIGKNLKNAIDDGINQIFKQNTPAYAKAQELFNTALKDYAAMKDIQKVLKEFGFYKEKSGYSADLNKLLDFITEAKGNEKVPNLERILGKLTPQNRAVVELNLLKNMLEQTKIYSQKLNDRIETFHTQDFIERLATLTERGNVFESKEAQDFIKVVKAWHRINQNHARILAQLRPANVKAVRPSISTQVSGRLAHARTTIIMENLVRLIKLPFGFLYDKTQAAALRYHLQRALENSVNITDFKDSLVKMAQKGNFDNDTAKIIREITKEADNAEQTLAKMDEMENEILKEINDLPTKSTLEKPLQPTEIKQSIDKWDLNNPSPNDKILISKVQGDELEQLKKEFDFKGNYALAREIEAKNVKHALTQHGDEAKEATRGQIAITKDDIANYQQFTQEPDLRIVQDNNRIIYAKQINGHYVVIEEVLTGQNKLQFFDMWKGKGKINKEVLLSHSQRPKHDFEPNFNRHMPSNTDEIIPNSSAQSQAPQKSLLDLAREETQRLKQAQIDKELAQKEAEIARLKEMKAQQEQIIAQKESKAGLSANEAQRLEIGSAIPTKLLKPTKIIINDSAQPFEAEFVIAKKSDIKPNFERTGTQGRSEKQNKVIDSIQKDFKPHLIFEQSGGFEGLPIITKDGQVIAGNHRAEAINALSGEQLARYKQAAKEKFSVDLADDEVIVRLVNDENEKDLINLAFMSNVGRESNLGEKALSNLAKFEKEMSNLPNFIKAESVDELQNIISKTLDKQGGGLNTFDTNLALFSKLAKSTPNNDILETLNALNTLSPQDKAKVLKMFVNNAGAFYNIAKDSELKSLNLSDYLNDAVLTTAKSVDESARKADFVNLLDTMNAIINSADEMIKIDKNLFENFKSRTLGLALARFARLENPSAQLFEFLKNAKSNLEYIHTGNVLGDNKALSEIDIYDFLSYAVNSGRALDENLLGKITSKLDEIRAVENDIVFAKGRKKDESVPSLFSNEDLAELKATRDVSLSQTHGFNEIKDFFKVNNKDKINAEIFEKTINVARKLGVRVRFSAVAERSSFEMDKNLITIATGNAGHFQAQDLLHELIHSTTRKGLKLYKENKHRAKMFYTQRQIEAFEEIESLYTKSKQIAQKQGQTDIYAHQSVDEFVAELSSSEFRKVLKAQDLFEKVIRAIVRFFYGEGKDSAGAVSKNSFEELKKAYYKILDEYEPPLTPTQQKRAEVEKIQSKIGDLKAQKNELLAQMQPPVTEAVRNEIKEKAKNINKEIERNFFQIKLTEKIGKANLTADILEKAQKDNKRIIVDKLDSAQAQKLGFDEPDYVVQSIDGQAINHTLKRHGVGSELVQNGQPPVTLDDIAMYPSFVNVAQETLQSVSDRNMPTRISFNQINGYYVVIEEVHNGQGELAFKTMYKGNGDFKNSNAYKQAQQRASRLKLPDYRANEARGVVNIADKEIIPNSTAKSQILANGEFKLKTPKDYENEYMQRLKAQSPNLSDDELADKVKLQKDLATAKIDSAKSLARLNYGYGGLPQRTDKELENIFDDGFTSLATSRKIIEDYYNIQPLKEFGTNYAEFYHDGENAVRKLLFEAQNAEKAGEKYSGQVAGAFWRKELGDIDLIWGAVSNAQKHEGYGLAHIIDKHGKEFSDIAVDLENIVKHGVITTENNNKIAIKTPRHTLILAKNDKNKFIVSAYRDSRNKKLETAQTGGAGDITSETLAKPLSQNQQGIIPQNSVDLVNDENLFHNVSQVNQKDDIISPNSTQRGENGERSDKLNTAQSKLQGASGERISAGLFDEKELYEPQRVRGGDIQPSAENGQHTQAIPPQKQERADTSGGLRGDTRTDGGAIRGDVSNMQNSGRHNVRKRLEYARSGGFDDNAKPTQRGDRASNGNATDNTQSIISTDNPAGLLNPAEKALIDNQKFTAKTPDNLTTMQVYEANIKALQTLDELLTSGKLATDEQKELLSGFSGAGGRFSNALNEMRKANPNGEQLQALQKLLNAINEKLPKDEFINKGIAISDFYLRSQDAYFTPTHIIKSMSDLAKKLGLKDESYILEPSAGVGRFLGFFDNPTRIHAVELDKLSANIARKIYPNIHIENKPFQASNASKNIGKYDLIIGNPPYSTEKIDGKMIHDYFMLKSIENLNENGISIQIITHNFMDKNSLSKNIIAQNAEFLGGVRLPNDAFKDAKVTTDILVFRKGTKDEIGTFNTDWAKVDEFNGDLKVSAYFKNNPRNVLGDFVVEKTQFGTALGVKGRGDNLQNLDLSEFINPAPTAFSRKIENALSVDESAKGDKIAKISFENGEFKKYGETFDIENHLKELGVEWAQSTMIKRVNDYKNSFSQIEKVKDILQKLQRAELDENASEASLNLLRTRLNVEFDKLAKGGLYGKNGGVKPEFSVFEKVDEESFEILALQKSDGTKADIFTKRVSYPYSRPLFAKDLSEAAQISFNELNSLDFKRMGDLLGKSEKEIENELLENKFIYKDSAGKNVIKEEFLSGDVKTKLESFFEDGFIKFSDDKEVAKYQATALNDLKAVIPQDIELPYIKIPLGANWLDKNILASFLKERLGFAVDNLEYTHGAGWNFRGRSATNDEFNIATSDNFRTNTGIGSINALDYVEDMLNNKTLIVQRVQTQKNGNKITFKDPIASQQLEVVKKQITNDFKDFIEASVDFSEKALRQYNDTFNRLVLKKYDGSHLSFIGKNKDINFRPHQSNGAFRIVREKNTLLAHEVGTGKTYTMTAAAMESKRLGLTRKNMIVLPNNVAPQFAAEARKLYPQAKIKLIQAVSSKQKNIAMSELKKNDYDIIISTYTAFEKLNISPQAYQSYYEEEISHLKNILYRLENNPHATKRQLNGIAKRIVKTEDKIGNYISRVHSEKQNVFFDDLGVDMLMFDEAHYLKSLPIFTTQYNVRGISTANSNRAIDAYMKITNASDKTKIVFATGTPITNYISDIFVLQRYLGRDTMEKQGVDIFDEWCKNYAGASTEYELKATGEYKQTTRLREFNNLPELQQSYLEFADVITKEQMREDMLARGLKDPEPTIKRESVILKRNAKQDEFMEQIIARTKELQNNPQAAMMKGGDNHLKIISDANKASLDMRLIDPSLPRDENGKIAVCAKNIIENYQKYDKHKGTQLVFLDTSTPKAKKQLSNEAKAKLEKELSELRQRLDEPQEYELEQLEKWTLKTEQIEEKLAQNDTKAFSAYEDLKQVLIQGGIKEKEIAFIHDYDKDKGAFSKSALSEKINSGEIRVLLGSTKKMGAGSNFQSKLVALHNLDLDWTPANMEQRLGRIQRQGNELLDEIENFEPKVYTYATEKMTDSLMLQVLDRKTKIIKSLQKSNLALRELEDTSEDNIYGMLMANTSPHSKQIIEGFSLQKEVDMLENAVRSNKNVINTRQKQIAKTNENLAKIERQKAFLAEYEKSGADILQMNGQRFDFNDKERRELINIHLKNALKNIGSEKLKFIGELRGKNLIAFHNTFDDTYNLLIGDTLQNAVAITKPISYSELAGGQRIDFVQRYVNFIKTKPLMRLVADENALKESIENAQRALQNAQNKDMSSVLSELNDKRARLDEIDIFLGRVEESSPAVERAKARYGDEYKQIIVDKINKESEVGGQSDIVFAPKRKNFGIMPSEDLAKLDKMSSKKQGDEMTQSKKPLEIQTQNADFKTLKTQFDDKMTSLKEQHFVNDETQMKATLANTGIKEIISNVQKSVKNGFDYKEHFAVAMDLENVFKKAKYQGKAPDTKHGDPNVTMYRFSLPVMFDNKKRANALLTLKEWRENGKRIYALKLDRLEKD